MDRLSSLLPKVLRRRGLHGHAQSALVMHCARRWLDEKLPLTKEMISVTKCEDGVLFVACTEAIALQECQAVFADLKGFLMTETSVQIEEIRAIRT
ncbi:hypothetical protein A2635_03335 [Candidatus Peribacteria bacterium RIFCSPHIGHO2_01_FULL_51_9]|nr:MAG: hypothetical protein A2635_03335 [Candidatus Peribacteria bacterium RIFCSPHIGHO2_01_FULL_51_9]